MPLYRYLASDKQGSRTSGEVVAPSTEEILYQLEQQGLELIEVDQVGLDTELGSGDARSAEATLINHWRDRISAGIHTRAEPLEVLQYAAQAMRHRLPLEATLRMLSSEMQNRKVRTDLNRLADVLEAGGDLPGALLTLRLPSGYSAMIARGIMFGRLEDVLRDLAIDSERTRQLRYNWFLQIGQPVLSLTVISLVTLALLGYVAASCRPIYEQFAIEINPILEAVLFVTDAVSGYWWLLSIVAVVLTLAGSALLRFLFRVGAIHRLLWATPGIGHVTRKLSIARFCRALARLIEFDVPLSESLQIAGDASLNFVVQRDAYAVSRALTRGEPLERAVRSIPDAPPRFLAGLDMSAYRKVLPELLVEIASGLESKAVRQSTVLVAVLRILVLILGGMFVGFMVVLLYSPLLQMLNNFR